MFTHLKRIKKAKPADPIHGLAGPLRCIFPVSCRTARRHRHPYLAAPPHLHLTVCTSLRRNTSTSSSTPHLPPPSLSASHRPPHLHRPTTPRNHSSTGPPRCAPPSRTAAGSGGGVARRHVGGGEGVARPGVDEVWRRD